MGPPLWDYLLTAVYSKEQEQNLDLDTVPYREEEFTGQFILLQTDL